MACAVNEHRTIVLVVGCLGCERIRIEMMFRPEIEKD